MEAHRGLGSLKGCEERVSGALVSPSSPAPRIVRVQQMTAFFCLPWSRVSVCAREEEGMRDKVFERATDWGRAGSSRRQKCLGSSEDRIL